MNKRMVLIQASSLCNFNCKYCYVPDRKNPQTMKKNVLEKSISLLFKDDFLSCGDQILWHAGEPLTVSMEFYEYGFKLINTHNQNNIDVETVIHTNGALITQEWCDFFKRHHIGIGISVDGPDFVHDQSRVNWKNKPTHHLVHKGIQLLKKNNIGYGVNCVLTAFSLDYPDEIYDYLKSIQSGIVVFNIEEIESVNINSSLLSLSTPSFEEIRGRFRTFFNKIYERQQADPNPLSISNFDHIKNVVFSAKKDPNFIPFPADIIPFNIVSIQREGHISTFSPELAGGYGTNQNAFSIGHVLAIDSIDNLQQSEPFKKLHKKIEEGVKNCAASCRYFGICGGGTPSTKFAENGSFESTETRHCQLIVKELSDVVISRLVN